MQRFDEMEPLEPEDILTPQNDLSDSKLYESVDIIYKKLSWLVMVYGSLSIIFFMAFALIVMWTYGPDKSMMLYTIPALAVLLVIAVNIHVFIDHIVSKNIMQVQLLRNANKKNPSVDG